MSKINSFAEFWPYYLSEHRMARTRQLHFVGSSLALVLLLLALWKSSWVLFLAAILSGYAFSWIGHFFAEKNRPASFRYPVYSFLADWKMWALMLTGRLDGELARRGIENAANE